VSFKELDVSRDAAAARELVDRTGQLGVPVTVIDGQAIVGFDRMRLEQALSQRQQGKRPLFGASVADASKFRSGGGSGVTLGAYVGKVNPGSVAEKMGLAPGDIITELNMQYITNAVDLENALSKLSKGSRISLVFVRRDKTVNVEGAL
jgi:S1-C subfamily serine protease